MYIEVTVPCAKPEHYIEVTVPCAKPEHYIEVTVPCAKPEQCTVMYMCVRGHVYVC